MSDHEPDDPSGKLRLSAEIVCGACSVHPIAFWIMGNVRSKAQAAQQARTRGWRLTKWDGWVCPECYRRKPGGGSK